MYANIGKLKLSPIEGSRNLQLAHYGGLPFAVGKECNEDDLYVIFMPDGQLGEVFAHHHDLVDRGTDAEGKRLGGYFGKNLKVRSIKLMGGKVTSVGVVMPLSCLEPWGDTAGLKEGDEVDSFNGVDVAHKYELTAKKFNVKGLKVNSGFPLHPDTKQFYLNSHRIEEGDLLIVTEKLDGTSGRFGYLPTLRKLNWLERMLAYFTKIEQVEYRYVVGSRAQVRNDGVWAEIGKRLEGKLLPGETLYGEIVGYDGQKPIQNRGGVPFTYGQAPGTCEFYVYNVRHTLPNGYGYDLSWNQIKVRCQEMGVKHVPEMKVPGRGSQWVFAGNINALEEDIFGVTDGPSLLGNHIREGVCVRVENAGGIFTLKSKSQEFYALEDKSKNAGEQDMEEAQ